MVPVLSVVLCKAIEVVPGDLGCHQAGEEATLAIQRIKRLQKEVRGREVMFRWVERLGLLSMVGLLQIFDYVPLMVMFRYSDTEETFTFSVYHCSHCPTSACRTYQELKVNTRASILPPTHMSLNQTEHI